MTSKINWWLPLFLSILSTSLYAQGKVLSQQDFKALVKTEDVSIIAITKPEDFEKGHLQGAVQAWRPDYADSSLAYGGVMASKEQMEQVLSLRGVNTGDKIVLYDHKGGCDAVRFWWILHTYGYDNTFILDGGYDAWTQHNQPIETGTPAIEAGEFHFDGEMNKDLFANLEDALNAYMDPDVILLDTRTLAEFNGDVMKEGAFASGRIPRSRFCPWTDAIHAKEDKRFRSIEELKEMYTQIGITGDKEVIVYCQSGVRSAHTTFVLTELLGYKNVRNYDGSWIEWSHNEHLPIEIGELPKKLKKPKGGKTPAQWFILIGFLSIGLITFIKIKLGR